METKTSNMKTVLAISLYVLLFTFNTNAQVLKAGINLANISVTNDGDVDENKVLASFQAGISGDIRLTDLLYLQPARVPKPQKVILMEIPGTRLLQILFMLKYP
jgi:hypothetical protein